MEPTSQVRARRVRLSRSARIDEKIIADSADAGLRD
jgi:hypothetical protein